MSSSDRGWRRRDRSWFLLGLVEVGAEPAAATDMDGIPIPAGSDPQHAMGLDEFATQGALHAEQRWPRRCPREPSTVTPSASMAARTVASRSSARSSSSTSARSTAAPPFTAAVSATRTGQRATEAAERPLGALGASARVTGHLGVQKRVGPRSPQLVAGARGKDPSQGAGGPYVSTPRSSSPPSCATASVVATCHVAREAADRDVAQDVATGCQRRDVIQGQPGGADVPVLRLATPWAPGAMRPAMLGQTLGTQPLVGSFAVRAGPGPTARANGTLRAARADELRAAAWETDGLPAHRWNEMVSVIPSPAPARRIPNISGSAPPWPVRARRGRGSRSTSP